MTDPDARLRFIEQVEYRGYLLKIARRGDEIRILIYPPGATLATQMVVDAIANHVAALAAARALIDRLLREVGFEDVSDD